jgi:hypothetical protein
VTRSPVLGSLLALALVGPDVVPSAAAAFQVLTVGKVARFANRGDPARNGGVVIVGRDRALATLHDPTCPSTSAVTIEVYLQSTYRDAILARVELDCARWSATAKGYRYTDPTGTVRAVRYGRRGLRIEIAGPGFTPIGGPVGFVQADLQVGTEILRARFHNFARNDATRVMSRKPSAAAATGEAGFWDVLLGDDASEARQAATIRSLEKAIRRDRRDGRSRFLLAMIRLYRFGQRVTSYHDVSAQAREELRAANAAFTAALPLLWDDVRAAGDSRVPGFAAGAKYVQGLVEGDAALAAAGLADLARAVEVNPFFNVFDYIPVLQALPPSDPVFQQAFALVAGYLNDPETLACVVAQPEICANAGLAPHNIQGSLVLFGDVFAKAGDLAQAQLWYGLVAAFPDTATWRFASIAQDRVANAATRVARYADADPGNDPPIIGAGAEACAVCHAR